ncbi:hypothetical protein KBY77_09795 [Synechococcus sp. Cruz-7E5]|nr:hypothetical protein [Synechococcus sp. Edmonson 11F2]MCP9863423.1 hypothetical protein [Synechococcus sp. Cruz-7E5]
MDPLDQRRLGPRPVRVHQPSDGGADSGLALELATRIRLRDIFSVTPALHWLTLRSPQTDHSASLSVWAALLRANRCF